MSANRSEQEALFRGDAQFYVEKSLPLPDGKWYIWWTEVG